MANLNSADSILSCAMCLGGAEGELAIAANTAVALMLVFVFFVLSSFFGFILYLAKKSKLAVAEDGLPGEQA